MHPRSPLTPLQQLWRPFQRKTATGLGRQTGQMMLRMTSKRVKEAVSKLRPPAVVKVSKAFREDARNGTAAERLQHILGQLEKLSSQSRITRLDLSSCYDVSSVHPDIQYA
jgi:hypothetical protein